ncbi:putative Zn finger-like uncharacterized protein [Humitalea rosea]|uniref:Putative Zn finger-like uncharacterized protein n=1 Tax=Humitalea rosea TaxID=990373 RepID=A0A2W7HZ30_9PROT|nr:zinc-ribbon domain-containing protein [Humitalea rosea]PZW37721.1 putative Zn finger-like uncharacterized protein [Humitalea rosea]
MRITCPACDASYDVPDGMLSAASEVRCVRCTHVWRPLGPAPMPAPPVASPAPKPAPPPVPPPLAPAQPAPAPRPRPPAFASQPPRLVPPPSAAARTGTRGLALAWIVSLLVLAGAAVAANVWAAVLIAAWPPLARVLPFLPIQ